MSNGSTYLSIHLPPPRVEPPTDSAKYTAADVRVTDQKLRVCDICGAFLSVYDSDRRLADHFGGKLHLGYMQIREKLADLMEERNNNRKAPKKTEVTVENLVRSKERSRDVEREGSRDRDRASSRDRDRLRDNDRRSRDRGDRHNDRSRGYDRYDRDSRSRHRSRSRSRERARDYDRPRFIEGFSLGFISDYLFIFYAAASMYHHDGVSSADFAALFYILCNNGAELLEELGMDQWAVASENRALMCTGVALGVAAGWLGSYLRAWIMATLIVSKDLSDPLRSHINLDKDLHHILRKAVQFTRNLQSNALRSCLGSSALDQGNRLCSQEGERSMTCKSAKFILDLLENTESKAKIKQKMKGENELLRLVDGGSPIRNPPSKIVRQSSVNRIRSNKRALVTTLDDLYAKIPYGNQSDNSKPTLVLDESCIKEHDFDISLIGKLSYLGEMWVLLELDSIASKEKFLNHIGVGSWFTTMKQVTNSVVPNFQEDMQDDLSSDEESQDDVAENKADKNEINEKNTPHPKTLTNSRPLPDFEEYVVSTSADTPYKILWSTF
ncbi:putative RNA-binding protein Luc7-like protein 2 [Tanacetum coccineum]|uniref:RNA-binding protein Luc7-like protein 2 n=1 Tax=Tanacetum coccineum TaxID=301880 RepID=A0ABQ5DAG3_9ASTR